MTKNEIRIDVRRKAYTPLLQSNGRGPSLLRAGYRACGPACNIRLSLLADHRANTTPM